MKIKLHATDELVNGHESVNVTAGGEDEAYWRSLGYAPEWDEGSEPAPRVAELAEWPLKSTPAEYLELHKDDEEVSDFVAERMELARKLVGGEGE